MSHSVTRVLSLSILSSLHVEIQRQPFFYFQSWKFHLPRVIPPSSHTHNISVMKEKGPSGNYSPPKSHPGSFDTVYFFPLSEPDVPKMRIIRQYFILWRWNRILSYLRFTSIFFPLLFASLCTKFVSSLQKIFFLLSFPGPA